MGNLPIKVGLFSRTLTNQISDSKMIELMYKLIANHSIAFAIFTLSQLWYIYNI